MRGSKRLRGSSWEFTVYLGRDKDGKAIRKYKTIGPDPYTGKPLGVRNADQELKNFMESLGGIKQTSFARMKFADYLDWWLKNVQNLNEETTVEWAAGIVERHIKPRLGHIRLEDLATKDIQEFYTHLLERGNLRTGKGLTLRSVNCYAKVLNAALNYAKDNLKAISENPASSAKLDKPGKRKYVTLDGEAIRKFVIEAKKDRLFALWMFFLFTGLRKSEALALRWQDVDLEKGVGEINQTITKYGKNYEFKAKAKTEDSLREFPIPEILCKILRAHKARQNKERLAANDFWHDNDLVFCYPDGRPLNGRSLARNRLQDDAKYKLDRSKHGRSLRTILARAGLPTETRIHDLRHSFATLLMDEGENQALIGAMLGHADGSTITNLYTHSNLKMKKRAAERLAKKYIPEDLVRSK